VKTLAVDKYQRVRLPDAKGGQRLAYTNNGDGTFLLTVVKADTKEPFPKGSLRHLFTKERDAEETAIAQGCLQGPIGPDNE